MRYLFIVFVFMFKVLLIFGVFGATRCIELLELDTTDVLETRSLDNSSRQFLVTIKDSKTDLPREFVVGGIYFDIVKKYMSLRPECMPEKRFFVLYREGKCIRQFIGKNKIAETPKNIALYLQLENPSGYTGHSFRRSLATVPW